MRKRGHRSSNEADNVEEVIEVTRQQAEQRATQLGLSIWEAEAIVVGHEGSRTELVKFCGFAGLELPLGEGETWEDAFEQALRVIFTA
jgi:hypothetical protein